jgi:spore coat protein H
MKFNAGADSRLRIPLRRTNCALVDPQSAHLGSTGKAFNLTERTETGGHFGRRSTVLMALVVGDIFVTCLVTASAAAGTSILPNQFPTKVARLYLEIPPTGVSSLRWEPRKVVQGRLQDASNVYVAVGIHLKGQGSFQRIDQKPSFTLKFSEEQGGQRFYGMRKVHLNNSVQDPSYLREYVGRQTAKAVGLPCPQSGHARLSLNGRDLGLYVMVEGASSDFLDAQVGNHDGAILEGQLQDIGGRLEVNYAGARADTNILLQIREAVQEANAEQRWERVQRLVDMDEFSRFMAFEALLRHADGYTYRLSNYRIYQNPAVGKILFIPHGMDEAFASPRQPALQTARGKVAQAVLEVPQGRALYARQLAALSTNAVWDQLPRLIAERQRLLQPILAERHETADFLQGGRALLEAIRQRRQAVREELAALPPAAWTNGLLVSLQDLRHRPAARTNVVGVPPPQNQLSNLIAAASKSRTAPAIPVHQIHVLIDDPAWATAAKDNTNWFNATVAEGTDAFLQVAVRLQGRSTRRAPSGRPSLTLRFDRTLAGQAFHGMTRCHLHNAVYDPAFVNEFLGYAVCRRAGLAAPRVEYAQVSINGQTRGLYLLVEGVTGDFLDRTFGNHAGSLYEGELSDVDGAMKQERGDRKRAVEGLSPLVEAAERTDAANGLAELRKVLDVDRFARFMAVEILTGQLDGYSLRINNYRIYQNGADGRFVFLPHGMDALFADPYARLMTPMKGLVARKFLESEEGKLLYLKALRQVLEEAFRIEDLQADLVNACSDIQPDLARSDPATREKQTLAAESLLRRLHQRHGFAWHQLRELEAVAHPSPQVSGLDPANAQPEDRKAPAESRPSKEVVRPKPES